MSSIEHILESCEAIIGKQDLLDRLKNKTSITIKAGFDPTSKDIHLGHSLLLTKLRQFQDLGHKVIFIIGDFTALVGDPSGRKSTRPVLTKAEIDQNSKTYIKQASKILLANQTKFIKNSAWFNKFSALDFINLSSQYTLARILERDDFTKRYNNKLPIYLHELIYPILQGYDSYSISSDIELGGTDQTFNMLIGRDIQKFNQQPQQAVITLKILEGLDGVNKMSKSLNNYIGITEDPESMFGKIMSISDETMNKWIPLLSLKPETIYNSNPCHTKIALALELIERYHSSDDAKLAHLKFINKFKLHNTPTDIEHIEVLASNANISFMDALKQLNTGYSNSEIRRLIASSGIKLNKIKLDNINKELIKGQTYILQIGKHKFLSIAIV